MYYNGILNKNAFDVIISFGNDLEYMSEKEYFISPKTLFNVFNRLLKVKTIAICVNCLYDLSDIYLLCLGIESNLPNSKIFLFYNFSN